MLEPPATASLTLSPAYAAHPIRLQRCLRAMSSGATVRSTGDTQSTGYTEALMRKVVASFFISLDGVVEAPQSWHFPYFNDEMAAVVGEAIAASDAFLLGRHTYEEWAAFWPTDAAAESPMAGPMNETPKYVVSTTLDKVEWQSSTLL